MDEEDRKAAEAFKKPTDMKTIKIRQYYVQRLKIADPGIFDYKATKEIRGYVGECAANISRQPIVLDKEEYNEMRKIYDTDTDIQFIVYPEDKTPTRLQKKQPNKQENLQGMIDGKAYPANDNKEIITIVKYGSKAKRINFYFCPRLFCIRDRLMVRYKDFKGIVDRSGNPKPAFSCPFCKGTLIQNAAEENDKVADLNATVLERKTTKSSDSIRQIYIGFLNKKKNPNGLSLPCCFADPTDRFDPKDPEFVRLGLRAGPSQAQPIADTLMGGPVLSTISRTAISETAIPRTAIPMTEFEDISERTYTKSLSKYEPDYFRVIQGVSVKSIVDANKVPLEIVVPKASAPADPKAGPQIGLLPETLDVFFAQDSASDKFADRLEIVRKLKPTAKGFLRLAVDNTVVNRPQAFFSALAPYFFLSNAEKVIDVVIDTHISPRHFLQLNGGNLVHEFFNKCEKKSQNAMRKWVSKLVGVDEFKHTNIPAIERLMNSYECFKSYIHDKTQRKDLRVFYQALSEPGVILARGILFIVLEVSVEDTTIKHGDKSEYKREIKFQRVRCPAYPLSAGQQNADVAFLIHYNEVYRERGSERKIYRNLGWEPLLYVDGNLGTSESRHKPTLVFQRSEEASWPPIVQKRVQEFFYNCTSINRGPFTSQFGFDPHALIAAQDLITGVRMQPNGIIRDSYNHLVGMVYKPTPRKSEFIAVPIADDGLLDFERRLFLDWDDYYPAAADIIIKFYTNYIINVFSNYRGYIPKSLKKSRDSDKIIGVTLTNGFVIPASDPIDPTAISSLPFEYIDDLEWDINKTIAYDNITRRIAFEHADVKDPDQKDYLQLKHSNIQDDIEDIYQHLRLTFSGWLSSAGAGGDLRDAIRDILKPTDLPLYEKRKRLDILLEDKVIRWMEPREKDELPNPDEVGFLRIDCLVQSESDCTGRCKWASESEEGPKVCKIHTPASINENGTLINIPRMLYLRLVDELIRYASRREELFSKQVSRLTIRKGAQRKGDQYIIPEGTPDWNVWWELLRTEWMTPDKESVKFFDEQYEPVPSGLPSNDTRVLPPSLEAIFKDDPKITSLVWNASDTEQPYFFLKSVISNSTITSKTNIDLTDDELSTISEDTISQVFYMPDGSFESLRYIENPRAINAIVIATIDGFPGWISEKNSFGVKLPLLALPNALYKLTA